MNLCFRRLIFLLFTILRVLFGFLHRIRQLGRCGGKLCINGEQSVVYGIIGLGILCIILLHILIRGFLLCFYLIIILGNHCSLLYEGSNSLLGSIRTKCLLNIFGIGKTHLRGRILLILDEGIIILLHICGKSICLSILL